MACFQSFLFCFCLFFCIRECSILRKRRTKLKIVLRKMIFSDVNRKINWGRILYWVMRIESGAINTNKLLFNCSGFRVRQKHKLGDPGSWLSIRISLGLHFFHVKSGDDNIYITSLLWELNESFCKDLRVALMHN